MNVQIERRQIYTYELTKEEEELVAEEIRNNPDNYKYMPYSEVVVTAVSILYDKAELSVFTDDRTTDTDCLLESFSESEFDETDIEEWFENHNLKDIVEYGRDDD